MEKRISKRLLSTFLAIVMTVLVIPTTVINTAAQNAFEDVTELKSWQSIGYGFNAITGNLSNPEPSTNAILDFEKMESAGFGVVGSKRTGADGGYIKSQTMSEIVNSYTDEFAVDVNAKFPIKKVNLGVEAKFSNKDSGSSSTVKSELYQMYYSNAIRNKYSLRGYNGNVSELSANLSEGFKDQISVIEQKILRGEDATEEIKRLYEYYGTHLILSYYTGGRLEITNHLTSSEKRDEQKLAEVSSLGISAGIGSFSIGLDISNTNTVTNSSKDEAVNEAIKVKNFGGLYPELTAFTSAAYSNWLNSLDDQKNHAMIGFVNDYSLVPIWELVDNSDVKGKMYAVFNNQCQTACSEYYTKYKDNESKIVGYVYKNAGVNNYAYVDMTANGAEYVGQDSTLYLNFLLSSEYISKEDITYEISTGSNYATVGEKSGILTVSPRATDGSTIVVSIMAGGIQLATQGFEVKSEGANLFAGGYGTLERPYLISEKEDFLRLADAPDVAADPANHFLLTKEFDMEGAALTPIPAFGGCFDGNGYAVFNFLIDSALDVTGLFREVTSTGTVKNLQIGKADFSNDVLDSKIENVSKAGLKGYSAIIYADNYYTFYVGGLVGKNYGTVENCKVVNTLVYGYAYEDSSWDKTYICMAGGLTGLNMGNVANCEVTDSYVKSYVTTVDDSSEPQCCAYSGGLIGMDGTKIPRDWRWDEDEKHKEWEDKTNSTTINYSTVGNSIIDSYVYCSAWDDGDGYIRSGGLIGYYKTSTTAIKGCIVYENELKVNNKTDGNSKYGSFIGFVPDSEYDISSCYAGGCSDTKYEIGNILDVPNGLTGNLTLSEMNGYLSSNSDYIVTEESWPQLNRVNAIKLNTDNVKKEYEKEDVFNPLGLIVNEKYAEGNKAFNEINYFQLSAEPFSTLGTKEIEVTSYAGYQERFNVSVICKHAAPTKITGHKATCTDTGLTDGLYCSDCGIWLEEQAVIEKNNDHSFGAWSKLDEIKHSRSCICGETENADHDWDKEEIITSPTHTSEGVKALTCTTCGTTKIETIDPITDHSFGSWTKHDENQHIRTCGCGEKEYADHAWDGGIVTTEATHLTSGEKTYACTECTATKTEEIPPIEGHTFGEWTKHDDTQHVRLCECGETEYKNHAWDDGTITTPATYEQDGVRTYTCFDCKTTYTVAIPKPVSVHRFVVDDAGAVPGGTMQVNVRLENNPGIAMMRLKISYDSSVLALDEVTYNADIGGTATQPTISDGYVTLLWYNDSENVEGDWIFATLSFTVKETAPVGNVSDIVLTYDAEEVCDIEENNVVFSIDNGSATVLDHVPGDINGDDGLTSKDLLRLARYFAGWEVEVNEKALDINGDGNVNSKDLLRLARYLAGWDVEVY